MGTWNFSRSLLIIAFFIYTLNSENILGRVNALKAKNDNECQRCKILTKSVKHWLAETSRGFHEGGDTAWQEAKLKSYARSEMRLVEIQERLCSELESKYQNECYAIMEETDQLLDKWWFHEDYKSLDLFTWLCIETLLYCCPKNHYGPSCSTCPINIDHKVCGNKGKCDGEGTRQGNGTCICKKGYTGKLCEKCAENHYITEVGTCDACHASCQGCDGEGPEACHLCRIGWQLESGVCVDIDECADLLSVCNPDEFCINKDGSYSCTGCHESCQTCKGEGPRDCVTCASKLVMVNGMCIDDQLLTVLMQRTASYIIMIFITIFLFQRSQDTAYLLLSSLIIIIYYYEVSSEVGVLDIIHHIFF